jgi:putative SOS response-associated peptidase YedK
VLKEYLIRGYAINEQKLREQAERFAELRQTVNVRAMSKKLRVPLIAPVSRFQGGAGSPEQKDDIRPTDLSPIITHHRPREIKFLRWGLIPPFVNQKEVKPMFSARAETLTKLASFRDLIMVSRCLIINAGFFETEKTSDEQIQHQISPA